jgi:succinate-acetate transporter protein
MLVCAVRTNTLLVAVFGVLFLTFAFLTWGEFSGVTGITRIGGYLGLVTAVLAWYGSMAGVLNATAKHTVLPVFPRS